MDEGAEYGDWLDTARAVETINTLCPQVPINLAALQQLIKRELQGDAKGWRRRHFAKDEMLRWEGTHKQNARWFLRGDAVERFARRRCAGLPGLEDERLSLREAGERAGVSHETIRQAVEAGALPAQREGRRILIDPADLDTWAKERAT